MDREQRRALLPLVVLAVLARGPTYGYDLAQVLGADAGGLFAVKEGTLYPILYRFEEAGWVKPQWDVRDRGVPRKYYELTEAGRAELRSRLRDWHRTVEAVEAILRGTSA